MNRGIKLTMIAISFAITLLMPLLAKADPIVQQGYKIEIYASGLQTPMGLAFDSQGNLFVGDDHYSVYKITPDGNISIFANVGVDAEGVAVDSEDNIFISGGEKITKIDQNGLTSTFASGFSNLNGIAIDNNDNIYVADLFAGKILKVAPDGSVNLFSSSVQQPSDVVYNSDGELFVSDVGFESILNVLPDGDVTTYYNEVGVPVFHHSGDLYLANPTLLSVGEILKISPEGYVSTFASGFQHPRGLVFDSSNNLFVTDRNAGIVYKISPVAITIETILTFFDKSVVDSSLIGDGQGNSASGRLNALRNMLEMAGDLIAIGDIEGSCVQLGVALGKCDGQPTPPDFVIGEATEGLYNMILDLITELGCE